MKSPTLRILAVFALVAIGTAAVIVLNTPARPGVARAVAYGAPASGCDTISCTTYLPLVFGDSPPSPPPALEITQGIQQPDNSVVLVADRPTFARLTLTSTVSHAGVNAWLYGSRDGTPLPDSPIPALNNPRTLKTTANRASLGDTFNFELPTSWASENVTLEVQASNGFTYDYASGPMDVQFTQADSLHVTIVPIAYTCTSGGTTTPTGPHDYVTDFTYRIYPVPSITSATHASISHSGPCTNGVPDPAIGDWETMLYAITALWQSEGRPNNYYYGLVKIDCSGGCIAGIGWVGGPKAAVGFDGIGPQHAYASETHAHEVGHNHDREHAPGCDAANPDPYYPYISDGKGTIGNSAHPNYGFNIDSLSIYPYTSYYDTMGYCSPEWVSDYTYEALLAYAQADAPDMPQPEHAFLVSGSIDSAGKVTFRPAYVLETPTDLPDRGDLTLELLDARGHVIAAYPFQPFRADVDRWGGMSSQHSGFHLAVPHVEGVALICVRHSSTILGKLESGAHAPAMGAEANALDGGLSSPTITWSATDVDGDELHYLVRASTDGGATWQVIGVDLTSPAIALSQSDFGGQSVLVEVLASDGLHMTSLRLGPFAVPQD
ncbi:MAG: hypothetical protein JXA14_07105 [Anaerolineae bacterium]|nr:hypothetical protein [Anaerolineae bacterium]